MNLIAVMCIVALLIGKGFHSRQNERDPRGGLIDGR
jgi:hypothetical protein